MITNIAINTNLKLLPFRAFSLFSSGKNDTKAYVELVTIAGIPIPKQHT